VKRPNIYTIPTEFVRVFMQEVESTPPIIIMDFLLSFGHWSSPFPTIELEIPPNFTTQLQIGSIGVDKLEEV
jgi:hypothetical protein